METMAAVAVATAKEVGHLSSCFVLLYLGHPPPFISKQIELEGYNAFDDALCSGHPVWHVPGELERD
jgi:hypothetical protein